MRILHVVTAFPRTTGDVIVPWLVELLHRLQADGHEVEVFTSAYQGLGDQVIEGLPVHRFRYSIRRWENLTHEETAPDRVRRSLFYGVLSVAFVLSGTVAIWRLCRRHPFDIIHVHWPMPLALWGWAAQAACGAPVVTTFYGVELRWVKRSLPFLKGFVRWAARRSARIVAISSHTAEELREFTDRVVEVIPYGSAVAPRPLGQRARAEDGPFEVLFVGRLVQRKGVSVLIDAMARIHARVPVHLSIVGAGPERSRLEAQVGRLALEREVEFWGQVPASRLLEAYSKANVFVLPAVEDARGDTEGLGVVLLEAMSHGVPVVGSRIGGIVDIVIQDETGLLVPPADADALASAIRALAENPALAERLGQGGRRHVGQHFSWETVTKKWNMVYRSCHRATAP